MTTQTFDGQFMVHDFIDDLIASQKQVKDEDPPPEPTPRAREFRSINLED
jgi:hypothetical protein